MADTSTTATALTSLIQKQMLILGPNVALGRARKVAGLTVGDNGAVTGLSGDPQQVMNALVSEYVALTGDITKTIVQSLIESTH